MRRIQVGKYDARVGRLTTNDTAIQMTMSEKEGSTVPMEDPLDMHMATAWSMFEAMYI